MNDQPLKINPERIESSVQDLKNHLEDKDIELLIDALETLAKSPQDKAKLLQLNDTFNALDNIQGTVLTYAPYIGIMLSRFVFKDVDDSDLEDMNS